LGNEEMDNMTHGDEASAGEGNGVPSGLRCWLRRLRYDLGATLGELPALYLPLARAYCCIMHRYARVTGRYTEIVIEAFPRSANSFASVAFEQAQSRPVRIAHHAHSIGSVVPALRRGLPVLILLRDPDEAVLSYHALWPWIRLRQLFREYVRFYSRILPYPDGMVVATFRQVTEDFGAVIHIDTFGPLASPYHGVTIAEDAAAMIEELHYWRSRGVDVTTESFQHEFAGLVPMVYHLNLDEASRLKYPTHMICGGGDGWNVRRYRTAESAKEFGWSAMAPEGGCLYDKAWGLSTDLDLKPPLKGFVADFALKVVPWHFLNRRRPIEHVHTREEYRVHFSDDVRTTVDTHTGVLRLTQEDRLLLEGNDLCLPAAWTDGWLFAYSSGGKRREWALPTEWAEVRRAAVRGITEEDWSQAREVPVQSGCMELQLEPGEAVWIKRA